MATDKDKKKPDSEREPETEETTGKKNDERSATEPVVRDRRRVDPETGEARVNPEAEDVGEQLTEDDLAKLLEEVVPEADAEANPENDHLNDLKRVQAEYANYRKRVDRDRNLARELAVAEVVASILPVLDDLDLAHAHGDLEGSPLELVAQKIRATFQRYGLEQVGAVGDPFDPNLHEAIARLPSAEVTVDTVADVAQPGYLLGERLLRPAKVAVSVPED